MADAFGPRARENLPRARGSRASAIFGPRAGETLIYAFWPWAGDNMLQYAFGLRAGQTIPRAFGPIAGEDVPHAFGHAPGQTYHTLSGHVPRRAYHAPSGPQFGLCARVNLAHTVGQRAKETRHCDDGLGPRSREAIPYDFGPPRTVRPRAKENILQVFEPQVKGKTYHAHLSPCAREDAPHASLPTCWGGTCRMSPWATRWG